MGEDFEAHFTVAGPIRSGIESVALVSLDHTDDGFHLPALPIRSPIKVCAHSFVVFAGQRLQSQCRSAMFGWNRRADVKRFPDQTMIGFAVITGVGQQMLHGVDQCGLGDDLCKLIDVDAWPVPVA